MLLYRNSSPNKGFWNGLGGKLEPGETVIDCLYREIREEADIDLSLAELYYTGVVCWNLSNGQWEGMYSFVAHVSPEFYFSAARATREGYLVWKKLDWLFASGNTSVVSNIPQFLPTMLSEAQPHLYRCHYRNSLLEFVRIEKLPFNYSLFSMS